MDLHYVLVFSLLFGACFTLLLLKDRVKSTLALRLAWTDLGLSLFASALATILAIYGRVEHAFTAEALAQMLLGAACICLPFSVLPVSRIAVRRASNRPTSQPRKTPASSEKVDEFAEWAKARDHEDNVVTT